MNSANFTLHKNSLNNSVQKRTKTYIKTKAEYTFSNGTYNGYSDCRGCIEFIRKMQQSFFHEMHKTLTTLKA